MDAARYFEEMHLAMSSQKPEYRLVLSVKVQDLGGADAYLEQSCHNASGELTGRFPATAEGLLAQTDFSAFIRDDALDSHRMEHILYVLAHTAGGCGTVAPSSVREGALITVERFAGRPAHWSYWSARAAEQLNIAAILCWLGDYLAGAERRTLQSCPEAMQLAAAWQAALLSPLPQSAQRPQPAQTPRPIRRAPAVENPRWQSILAVLATV